MILKYYYVDWIISWVAYWIAFMSVFFTLEKLVLKSGSTPCYMSGFSSFFYHNPNNLLILGGSIEKAHAPSTASWHLVDRSRKLLPPRQLLDTWWIDQVSVLGSNVFFLDTCSIYQLSTTISSIPTSIASSTPLNTCIYWALLRVYIYFLRDPFLISSISLDLSTPVHLPNSLSLTLQTTSFGIFKLFQDSSSLGKLLISYSSCISYFEI